MNFYKRFVGDYQRDTGHLSIVEHGAYTLMLDVFYATEKPLPLERTALYRLIRAQSKDERAAIDSVLDQFWTATDAGWINGRGSEEIEKSYGLSAKNRAIAVQREEERRRHEASTRNTPETHQTNNQSSTKRAPETHEYHSHSQIPEPESQTLRDPDRSADLHLSADPPDPGVVRNLKADTNLSVARGSRKKRASAPCANGLTAEIWKSYCTAYHDRYGVDPVRNAKTNAMVAQLAQRLGQDAPAVAAYYCQHNAQWYTAKGHGIGALLADAEKLHTEWRTGTQITQTTARVADRTAHTGSVFRELIAEERAKQLGASA